MEDASTPLEKSVDGVLLKSGPLFISSKALGWKSWKKRWFILTNTSLVFFKSDPSVIVHGGGELNLTLGGIDLNNSARLIVREDKKFLTILFPDGQDGRGFTLKTETSEDLHEWRNALELAFTQAPCPAPITMKDGILIHDAISEPFYHFMGTPISLAMQQANGGPSLLEKAICFIEEFGINVEGILRISADVEEVQRRIQEFEQGKSEFDASEDAHVIGDCIKHMIRELPTSLVSNDCCNELLKAYERDQYEAQIKAFRVAIMKNLPVPNLLIFQRIIKMMNAISCTPENHMTPSALAACMAPLLLRPILAGECNLYNDVRFSDDDSGQLLATAYAAKTAQCIITLILEEYQYIFSVDNSTRYSISADLENDKQNEDSADDSVLEKKNMENLEARNTQSTCKDDNCEHLLSDELSSSTLCYSDLYGNMELSPNLNVVSGSIALSSSEAQHGECRHSRGTGLQHRKLQDICQIGKKLLEAEYCAEKSIAKPASPLNRKASSYLKRVSANKLCSVESLDTDGIEMLDVRQLEMKISDLQRRLAKEVKVNKLLHASLERRKQALLERRSTLHRDVEKLQEQIKSEKDLRIAVQQTRDEQDEIAIAEADVARLKQKVTELHHQLSHQQELYDFPSYAPCKNQHAQNVKPRQRSLQQDFDSTLASVNYERMQKARGISSQPDRRAMEGTQSVSNIRSFMDHIKLVNSMSFHNSVGREVSCYPDIEAPRYRDFKLSHSLGSSPVSSTLSELANRVSFFRKRESELVKQRQYHDAKVDST